MVFLIRGIPLNNDVVLTILAQLTVRDVLAMRQVCKALRDLTHERSVWASHYAEMVRDRQLPAPMVNRSLSQPSLEATVRRNMLIEIACRRANPKMESLRSVTLPAAEHRWTGDIRRGFMVPGGKYLVIFVPEGAYTLSLEEPCPKPISFLSLPHVELGGHDCSTFRWSIGRPDDGSLTLYAIIRPFDRAIQTEAYAFWSASFHVYPPTPTYHGQFKIRQFPRSPRTKNELFMFNTEDGDHIIVFDWKALLRGGSFRYAAFRVQAPNQYERGRSLRDFCMLPNGCILTINARRNSLDLLASPEFQTVDHLNQPLPMECAKPIWQCDYQSIDPHHCTPLALWSVPLCHPYTDNDESSALLCGTARRCCCQVETGLGGPKVIRHHILPDEARFLPGRTKALVVTVLDREDGLRIGCLSYAPKTEWEDPAPQPLATFDISMASVPGWDPEVRPWGGLRGAPVYFDEESGRMCFLLRRTAINQDGAAILVLDFI